MYEMTVGAGGCIIEFNDPSTRTHAYDVLRKLERDFRLENNMVEGSDVTFVGVHDRRTDYLEFRRKRLKLRPLYRGYFEVLETNFIKENSTPLSVDVTLGRIRVLSNGVRQRDFRVRLRRHGVGEEEPGRQQQRRLFRGLRRRRRRGLHRKRPGKEKLSLASDVPS